MKAYYRLSLFILLFSVSASAYAQSWNSQPNMQVKRSEAAAVEYKGELYVFNGFSKGLFIGNSIEKFNPNTKQWKIIGATSVAHGTAVSHTGTVLVGNEVWLLGGRIGAHPGKVTDNVWLYNLDKRTWRKGPKLPKPMAGGGAALVDNKIYIFGGMDANAKCDVNFHYVYNLGKPSLGWQNKTASAGMPSARNHFSTVVVDKVIYAIGGQHGHDGCPSKKGGNVALVHSYSPQTNKWQKLANLPAIESHNEPSTFVHNGFIYTVGGATAGNKVLRFDPAKNKWQHIVNLPEPLLAPVARIYNGKLIVAGGGAPITAKSKPQVRSIALAKFNDVATKATNTPNTTNLVTSDSPVTTSSATTGNSNNVGNSLVISVEAELYSNKTSTNSHSWVTASQAGASAGKSMKATPDKGSLIENVNASPKLSYNVRFDKAGTYQLWVRGWGDEKANGIGSNDSLHAGLNGVKSNTADKIDGFPSGWHWSNSTRDGVPATLVVPSAGVHQVNLWMREDGFAIDQFLLVDSASYVPQGAVSSATGTVASNNSNTGSNSANVISTNNGATSSTTTATTTTSAPATLSEVNGLITIEAENFDSKTGSNPHHWVNGTYANASGGKSMISTPNNGKLWSNSTGSPKLSYKVNFAASGIYHLWIRGWGDENSNGIGGNDSVHAGLNGLISSTADKIDGFPTGWHWSNRTRDGVSAKITVPSAGVHTFNLWMREDGFAVDKIVLTKKATYKPDGVNVAATAIGNSSSSNTNSTNANSNTSNTSTANANTGNTNTSNTSTNSSSASVNNSAGTVLTVEAEDFLLRTNTSSHRWVNANLAGASSNGSMITTPDVLSLKSDEKNSPMLSYLLNFPEQGKYYLWVRGWGDERSNGAGSSDSINAGLNGKLSATADKIDGFPNGWHWSRRTRDGVPATLTVPSAGTHSVNFWMREDGFAIDKFVLTKDFSYQPEGVGVASATIITNSGNQTNQQQTTSHTPTTQSSQNAASFVAPALRAWELVQTANGSAVAARHEAGAVAVNDVLYVMGGRGNRPVQSYDLNQNKWTSHGKAPVLMHHFQPVAIDNKIYVIGALKDDKYPNEKPLEHVYIFNTNNHTWTKSTAIPVNRRRGSVGAAVYNNKIYLVGGNTVGHSGTAVTWFDEYNPANQQWRRLPNAPKARDHITVAIAGNKLVVAGGRRSKFPNVIGDTEARTDVYNFNTQRWETTAANIPTQRAGAMSVAVGDEVIVIGGESKSKVNAHNDVEALNVKTGKWRKLQPLLVGRHSGGAALLDNKVHVISGNTTRGGGNESTSHETLRLNTK